LTTHREPPFGSQDHAFGDVSGSAGEPATDDLFRLAAGVHVCRVHQSASRLDEAIQLLVRAGLVRLGTEGHGSQAERGNGAAAASESAIVHVPVSITALFMIRSGPGDDIAA
jgi:hypothetical protein